MGSMRSVVRTFSAPKIRIYFAHTSRRTCRHPSANMRAPKWPRRPESTKAALERASVLCKRLRDQLKNRWEGGGRYKGGEGEGNGKRQEADEAYSTLLPLLFLKLCRCLALPNLDGEISPPPAPNDIRGTEQPIVGHQPCPL